MQALLNTEIWNGKTLADLISLEFMATLVGSVLGAFAILFAGMVIGGWVGRRIRRVALSHESLDNTLFDFLGNIARYVIYGLTVLIVLNTFGVQTTSIVAVVASAGLAIGLALQGTLSNVAAGVMLILFRPLKNGDFVLVNGMYGTVKSITLNFTELASVENLQIIIPNAQVWGNTITNYSVYDTRRVEWVFGVGYGADLKKAEAIIRDTITADPRAHTTPEPFIKVGTLGASSVDFLVRVWANNGDAFAFEKDMNRAVKQALDAGGIDIPFPTRTIVNVAADAEG